jgi:ABC-type antimicrobial peptide transport system permease subunit
MDPDLPVFNVTTMEQLVVNQVAVNRASARVLTGFGGLALLLSAIGVYGVMGTAVAARTREIGIRVALGAGRSDVVGVVLRRGVAIAAVGIAVGVLAALASARLLDSLLYGVSATDAVTIAAVAAMLLVTTVIASYVPVRRALAVDPASALQQD